MQLQHLNCMNSEVWSIFLILIFLQVTKKVQVLMCVER